MKTGKNNGNFSPLRSPALWSIFAAAAVAVGMWWWSRPQPVPSGGTEPGREGIGLAGPAASPAPAARNGKDGSGKAAEPGKPEKAPVIAVTQWQDEMERNEDDGLSEARSNRDGPEWTPPPVSGETLSFIRDAFGEWRSSPRDEEAAAKLRLALAGKMSRGEMLAAAATLMRLGSIQDRLDAMWMVENEFYAPDGEEQLVRVNLDDDGEAGDGERGVDVATLGAEEQEAAETHDVVSLVSSGFEDDNPDVRQAAYAAAMALSQERNNILLSQLLCSDSSASQDLRRQLMEELAGWTDEESLGLYVAAMQSPDAATAAAAQATLEAMAGRSFSDVLDVANWLEETQNPPPDPGMDVDFEKNNTMENNEKGDMSE